VENILNRIWSSVHTEQSLELKTYWKESEAQIESGVENLLNRIWSSVHSEDSMELRTYRTASEAQYTLNRVWSWKPAEANLKLSSQWAVTILESRWRGLPSLNILNLLEREDELQVLKLAVHHDRRKIRIFLVNDHSMPRILLLCDRSERCGSYDLVIAVFGRSFLYVTVVRRTFILQVIAEKRQGLWLLSSVITVITLYSSISTSGLEQ
jgi:hypothetical protein